MKFCKNLQRVVDISDPEWAPYWTNYKMLKKLIKELPSLVPSDDGKQENNEATLQHVRSASKEECRPGSPSSVDTSAASCMSSKSGQRQHHGDQTTEVAAASKSRTVSMASNISSSAQPESQSGVAGDSAVDAPVRPQSRANPVEAMGRSPGEVAFFKLLHSELKKAIHFFDRAQEEFIIREERVREGMEIMKKPNSIMVNEKWSLLAKSLYRLYKDLLLLETFAIMTYCSFSKILKKHDKVTGYDTRNAFMSNVVNEANFTNYPKVLEMIGRCETLYEEVSQHLNSEGKEGLCEDERLFINMIHRLNAQVMDTAEAEGAPDVNDRRENRTSLKGVTITFAGSGPSSPTGKTSRDNPVTSSLRSLVEENDAIKEAGVVSGALSDDADDRPKCANCEEDEGHQTKRRIDSQVDANPDSFKRPRTE